MERLASPWGFPNKSCSVPQGGQADKQIIKAKVVNFHFRVVGILIRHLVMTLKIRFKYVTELNTLSEGVTKLKKNIWFFIFVFLAACSSPESKQVSSILSEGGEFKAVWVLTETFATDGFRYALHLVDAQHTEIPDDHRAVLRTDNIDETQVKWELDQGLSIRCTPGKVFYFSNFSDVGDNRLKVSLNTEC